MGIIMECCWLFGWSLSLRKDFSIIIKLNIFQVMLIYSIRATTTSAAAHERKLFKYLPKSALYNSILS